MSWKEELLQMGQSPASINRKLSTLRSFFKMMRTVGLVNWGVEVENVRSESYRDTAGPGITAIKETVDFLSKRSDKKSIRDLAILRLLFDLGLRRGEVCSLDLSDVLISESKIKILGKGHREKVLMSLPPTTLTALQSWISIRGNQDGALFTNFDRAKKGWRLTGTSIYRIITTLGKKVGKEMKPHGIRHTCITTACEAAAKNGIPFEQVIQLSRHRDVKTLMIYRDRLEDLQGKLSNLVSNSVTKPK